MPLDLARYAYELRPRYGNSNFYFNYFYSALLNLHFDEAQKIAHDYNFWQISEIQIKKDKRHHQQFHEWYHKQVHPFLERRTNDIGQLGPNLDITYITFSLLDVSQPDLAMRWVKDTGEIRGQMEAEPMIWLWTDHWQQLKWTALSFAAKNHIDSMQVHDQWRVAYLDIHAGLPNNAILYFERLLPNILNPQEKITLDTVRLAVYYVEALKQLKRKKQARALSNKIHVFLSKQPDIERSVYFGLTDIQFYAMNGQKDLALSLLEKAIVKDTWQPNAFWLWPPIDKDPFLQALNHLPRFKELATKQLKPFKSMCFGDAC